ncbi:hypothetical protein [Streptomyces sp. NPDC047014]|uniref:hypothetical protein n=1 Tax=Streptomyces sp. NPDC047014 TaxID=3155736 RepID=UPI0033D14365
MARGKKKRSGTVVGMPTTVLVIPTADGWATSIVGAGCGRPDPTVVDADQAKARAAALATNLARDVHGVTVEIDWEPPQDGTWTGHVREAAAR